MEEQIHNRITERLNEIENEHSVEILYAIESGSRAWGFESKDSDYDIRFIYKHTLDWYLNVLPKRDVIEYPIVDLFDYSGWDLRKTFFLMHKSNPVIFEWLRSPIVYMKNEKAYKLINEISDKYFSPISSVYHYLHMAKGNYRDYLQGEEVKVKKYFYVLRPLLSCMWIERKQTSPSIEFEVLLKEMQLPDKLLNKIMDLLQRKKAGIELGSEPRILEINSFIEEQIQHFEETASSYDPADKPSVELLEGKFRELLNN